MAQSEIVSQIFQIISQNTKVLSLDFGEINVHTNTRTLLIGAPNVETSVKIKCDRNGRRKKNRTNKIANKIGL